MRNKILFWLAVTLLTATGLAGCSDDNGGGGKAKSGTSAVSLRLSGGHLTNTLEFDGIIDDKPSVFPNAIYLIATGIDITASNGTAEFRQMTLDVESPDSGTYQVKDVDIDMPFFFPDISKSYSLRPIDGTGTVTVERIGDDRIRFNLDFDASPTQLGGRDQVFQLEGEIDSAL